MALVAVLSMTVGLLVGSFLTFQILVSYEESEDDYLDIDYNELAEALPSHATRNDSAVVDEKSSRRLVGNTDEIRAIFAKRRQGRD